MTAAAEALGLEGSYVPSSYIELVQLARLNSEYAASISPQVRFIVTLYVYITLYIYITFCACFESECTSITPQNLISLRNLT